MLKKSMLAIGLLLGLAQSAEAVETDAWEVIAYVSPRQLFVQSDENLPNQMPEEKRYDAMPIYDAPGGNRIGNIRPIKPENGSAREGVAIELNGNPLPGDGQGALALETEMWGYDLFGLQTYDPVVYQGDRAWTRLKAFDAAALRDRDWSVPADLYKNPYKAFWIETRRDEVHEYIDLTTSILQPDQWCRVPGQCVDMSAEANLALETFRNEMLEKGFPVIHDVEVVRRPEGDLYHVRVRDDVKSVLPAELAPYAEGFVPVRRRDNTHVGDFSPKGC